MSKGKRVPIPKKNLNESLIPKPELRKIDTDEQLSPEQ